MCVKPGLQLMAVELPPGQYAPVLHGSHAAVLLSSLKPGRQDVAADTAQAREAHTVAQPIMKQSGLQCLFVLLVCCAQWLCCSQHKHTAEATAGQGTLQPSRRQRNGTELLWHML
jgi:hypothetical protein